MNFHVRDEPKMSFICGSEFSSLLNCWFILTKTRTVFCDEAKEKLDADSSSINLTNKVANYVNANEGIVLNEHLEHMKVAFQFFRDFLKSTVYGKKLVEMVHPGWMIE